MAPYFSYWSVLCLKMQGAGVRSQVKRKGLQTFRPDDELEQMWFYLSQNQPRERFGPRKLGEGKFGE